MLPRFKIHVKYAGETQYEVFQFSTEIYFVRSLPEQTATMSIKGTSIWKVDGDWVSPGIQDELLVQCMGACIEDHHGSRLTVHLG